MGIDNHKKILIAPLDWGLGHTTRCLPLVRHLIAGGHHVTFAGNTSQLDYIKNTALPVETIYLEGYNVTYSRTRRGFLWSLVRQVPRLLQTIKLEHSWLDKLQMERGFDGVISDNRYGLYHHSIPSVIITHQLQIQTGTGKTGNDLVRGLHYRLLNRFNQCWIADVAGSPNLSGTLAHPDAMPDNAKYIGLLSQLDEMLVEAPTEKHLLVLLSGPEPQRTILAKKLWQQLQSYNGKVAFVEGTDDVHYPAGIPAHISYYRRITKDALQPLLANAGMVICRSGYSTLMDLARMQKKAILIPTPGQTEQEYLARYLQDQQVFLSACQQDFNLQKALKEAESFAFNSIPLGDGYALYKQVLDEWVASL